MSSHVFPGETLRTEMWLLRPEEADAPCCSCSLCSSGSPPPPLEEEEELPQGRLRDERGGARDEGHHGGRGGARGPGEGGGGGRG